MTQQHGIGVVGRSRAEHCSAFVATGSYTKDGRVVIAHNNWTSYLDGRALEHHFRHRARARATTS